MTERSDRSPQPSGQRGSDPPGNGRGAGVEDVVRAALRAAGDRWDPRCSPAAAMETAIANLSRRRRRRAGEIGLGGALLLTVALVLALVVLPGQASPVGRLAVTGAAHGLSPAPRPPSAAHSAPAARTRSAVKSTSVARSTSVFSSVPFVPPYVPPSSLPAGSGATGTTTTTVVYPSPPAGGITVTEADSGRTVTLSPGQHLDVALRGSRPEAWSGPRSSDPAVLATVSSSTDPATGDATARLVAVAAGQARAVATESPACSPACGVPSRAWSVTVVVTG